MRVQFGPLGQCLQPAGQPAMSQRSKLLSVASQPVQIRLRNLTLLMVARKGNPYDVSQSRKVLSVTILRVNVRK